MYVVSYYNSMMKLSFIGATIYIIYLMKFSKPTCIVNSTCLNFYNNQSYDRLSDDVPHYYVIPVALFLTAIIHTKFSFFEMAWSFSIWLEALAIIPQLRMVTKLQEVENLTSHYIATLGLYRFFYILSWYKFVVKLLIVLGYIDIV